MTALIALMALLLLGADPPSEVPLAASPYRVVMWLDFEAHPRFPPAVRSGARRELENLVAEMIGGVWDLTIVDPPAGLAASQLPTLEFLQKNVPGADKILWLTIGAANSAGRAGSPELRITAREYDFEFEEWGPLGEEVVVDPAQLGRQAFELAFRQFRPTALLTGPEEEGSVRATVRGLALQSAQSPLPFLEPGAPFRVYRDFFKDGKRVAHVEVPWTYLVYRDATPDRLSARLELATALRNPLSTRARGRSRFVAIASGVWENGATTIKFVTGPEEHPVVGYEVSLKPQDKPGAAPIGDTDREGSIAIPAASANDDESARLVQVILSDGKIGLASFPLAPGDRKEAVVRVRVDPLLAMVDGRTLALQEEVVDVVARRMILNRQLRHVSEKNDAAKANEVAKQLNELPDKPHFQRKLQQIKTDVEERAKIEKRLNLGSSINRLFLQTENLIEEQFQGGKVVIEVQEEKVPAEPAKKSEP